MGVVSRPKRERVSFAETVEALRDDRVPYENTEVQSPLRDRAWWCDRTATSFVRRGNELATLRRIKVLMSQAECIVVHHYLGELRYIDDMRSREELLARALPYLAGEPTADHDFTDFVAAEYKDSRGRHALIFDERC